MNHKKLPGTRQPQQPAQRLNVVNSAPRSLPWASLEQQVVRMQKQIAQASQHGDRQAVHTLQQRLMEAEAARLLAVRRVAVENAGKDTAGVDGVKSLTASERLAMASTIHPANWKQQSPMPVRRVWIPKLGTPERRPLAILTMIDRCKQALVKLALEPEWETKFESHSYGFRPGQGTHDAIAAILVAIERRPGFVFDADIEGAFEHVSQAVVLDKLHTFPMLRNMISAWLTAGVMEGDTYFPSETGIAQGGVLSPLLMNIALHGMEAVVTETSPNRHARESREQPLLVRYADDFVIIHPDLRELQQAARRVMQWLATMGLRLHAGKTRFTHTLTPYHGQVGFDFLGFTIRQDRREPGEKKPTGKRKSELSASVKTSISPRQEAITRHLTAIEQRLQQLQNASQAQVISGLNPLIVGWAAYYNGVVPAATMSRYDDLMEQRLLTWASRRHPGKARDWLLTRYWHPVGKRRVFATPDGEELRAYRPASVLK